MNLNILKQAEQLLGEVTDSEIELSKNINIYEYIPELIRDNLCSTIALQYSETSSEVILTTVYTTTTRLYKFDMDKDLYNELLVSLFKIDINELYNFSKSMMIEGVKTRIFGLMKPFSNAPIITISTTKEPPTQFPNQNISDEILNKIVHSSFLIIGGSGAGKTYFMNYMMSKFIGEKERILFIEEFSELIPPNDLTNCILCPPPKPGEESMLRYITEQSNLMRLDAFYIGEVKGAEAWPMLINFASGTRGGSTIHGDTFEGGMNRLRALCQYGINAGPETINEFISKHIKYAIVIKNQKITEVRELKGTHVNNIFQASNLI